MRTVRFASLLCLLGFSLLPPAVTRAQETAPAAVQGSTSAPAPPPVSSQTPASAQNPSAPVPTIRTGTRLVVLDAVVLDSKGMPITDLKREDFHVTEDGVPQEIRNFDLPGKYTPPATETIDSTADLERIAPRAPVNIVLLDEFNTLFEDEAFARYSLKRWLNAQPAKLDTPTMLIAVSLQKFEVLRDYTENKQEILDALDHHFTAYPWQAHSFGWVGERYATAFLTLRRVADASLGHAGHKNMIWIGRGFPSVDRARFTMDENDHINGAMQITLDKLREARVTLYTIDPAGVMTDPGRYGEAAALYDPFGGNPDFQRLATSTGGRNLYGRNDVDAEIGSSIRDGSSIYTLTYRPLDATRDITQFRHIAVTVDRPGLKVVTTRGYFQQHGPARLREDGTMGRNLRAELTGAENSNMVYDAVAMRLMPSPTGPDSVVVHVDGRSLNWTRADGAEPRHTGVILIVSYFDKKGKELSHDARAIKASAPPTVPPEGRLDRPLDIDYKLAVNPKAVRARLVVRVDSSGRMSSADLDLTRPLAPQLVASAAAPAP